MKVMSNTRGCAREVAGAFRRMSKNLARFVRRERRLTASGRMTNPAGTILLATDMSARCDRALDRAALLASQWQMSLFVLHVVEGSDSRAAEIEGVPSWKRAPDPFEVASKQLLADVAAFPTQPSVRVVDGDPVETILRRAASENTRLLVIGVERDESLGHFMLGKTADRLFRRSKYPLLLVKDRPRGQYQNIVFATDLSKSSRHALERALEFFPGQQLTIFHTYPAPSGLTIESGLHRQRRVKVEQEVQAFLAEMETSASGWKPPQVVIEDGAANALLRNYVREKGVDLLVLGPHERRSFIDMLLGNEAKKIVENVPCDALVVREPQPVAVEA